MKQKTIIAPSFISGNPCKPEHTMLECEKMGAELLHIDFIDGYFSPSLPIGLDLIKEIRKITEMDFSLHLMAKDNERFIDLLKGVKFKHITFHIETAFQVDRLLNMIHAQGIMAGVALMPATPLCVLDYIAEKCDVITIMLINPGYAYLSEEQQISYAERKISETKKLLLKKNSKAKIEIDGRIRNDQIKRFIKAGADIIVSGSSGLFGQEESLSNNYNDIIKIVSEM